MVKACVLFCFTLVAVSQGNLLNRQPVARSNVNDEYNNKFYQKPQNYVISRPTDVPVVGTQNRFGAHADAHAGAHAGAHSGAHASAATGGYRGGHAGGHLGGHVGSNVGGHFLGHPDGHMGAAAASAGTGGRGYRNTHANAYAGYGR